MKTEEFYNIIRRDSDPVDSSSIKQASTRVYYSKVEGKTVASGTAYWLNIFQKHGQKGFF